jgi:hypothetical protein
LVASGEGAAAPHTLHFSAPASFKSVQSLHCQEPAARAGLLLLLLLLLLLVLLVLVLVLVLVLLLEAVPPAAVAALLFAAAEESTATLTTLPSLTPKLDTLAPSLLRRTGGKPCDKTRRVRSANLDAASATSSQTLMSLGTDKTIEGFPSDTNLSLI